MLVYFLDSKNTLLCNDKVEYNSNLFLFYKNNML